ncbi:MAG TPA: zinc ribbon domain-containing protein YjdM [Marmoricola sp.]|nr:zinc ribbon domain-containing protein YjdM [Marmoricola sp.]
MTDAYPPCPQCSSEYTYELGGLMVCPECAHEWSPSEAAEAAAAELEANQVKDVNGVVLAHGDDVVIAKDLKVGNAAGTIKSGTKVKNIRLVQGVGDHDIEAKVDGFGSMQLKGSVVRKA